MNCTDAASPVATIPLAAALALATVLLPADALGATRKSPAAAPAAPPAPPSVCASQTAACTETRSFAAVITGMRASQSGNSRFVAVTVRFHNRTDAPLALGYVGGSGLVTDDQGNRYEIATPEAVRAIGIVAAGAVDAKFTLQPGETGDARFEFSTKLAGRSASKAPSPVSFALDLAVREIDASGTPGREHAVQFAALDPAGAPAGGAVAAAAGAAAGGPATATTQAGSGTGTGAAIASTAVAAGTAVLAARAARGVAQAGTSVPGSIGALAGMLPGAATTAATPAAAAAAMPQGASTAAGSACSGAQSCYDAGPFVAEVAQVTSTAMTPGARHHSLGVSVRFRNTGTQPLILAYKSGSGSAVDNFGAGYTWGRPGTHDTSAQGIGLSAGRTIDPQFVLQPGQASAATFALVRFNAAGTPIGSAFTYRLAVQEVQLVGGQVPKVAREHSLTFANLAPGSFAVAGTGPGSAAAAPAAGQPAEVAKQVFGIFRELQKK